MKKISTKTILLWILGIFVIKSLISLLVPGPIIFSDEPCVLIRAADFIKTFKIHDCTALSGLKEAPNPLPLFSIIISPLYLFLDVQRAFHGVLIINAFLSSLMLIPIKYLYSQFIKNDQTSLLLATITLFIPAISLYEKTVMTENFYLFTSLYTIYFYLKYLEKNKKHLLGISIVLALATAAIRPFGFIILVAIVINQAIKAKSRMIFQVIAILLILTFSYFFLKDHNLDIKEYLLNKYQNLTTHDNPLQIIGKGFINSFNSFAVGTFFLGFLLIKDSLFKNRQLKDSKYFFIIIIFLMFIINAIHIAGYYLEENEINLLIRYINLPIVLISIFGIGQLWGKNFRFQAFHLIFGIFIIFSLLGWEEISKHSNNLSISGFYKQIHPNILFENIQEIFIIYCLISLMLLKKWPDIVKKSYLIILITASIFGLHTNITKINYSSELLTYFKDVKEKKIVYYLEENTGQLTDVWKIIGLTNNKISYKFASQVKAEELIGQYDYAVTSKKLDWKLEQKSIIDYDNTPEIEAVQTYIYEIPK